MTLYSTYLDLIEKVPQLKDSETGILVKTKGQLRAAIDEASTQIKAALKVLYPSFAVSAWYKPPISELADPRNEAELVPTVTLGAAAQTEVITVRFTSATAFAVSGDLTGSIGTGSTAANFTSTTISIPSTSWVGTFAPNDKVYIRTYTIDPVIESICARLAASIILQSVYTDQLPNSVATLADYDKSSRYDLRDLQEQTKVLSLISPVVLDLDPEELHYDINEAGEDITTEYQED